MPVWLKQNNQGEEWWERRSEKLRSSLLYLRRSLEELGLLFEWDKSLRNFKQRSGIVWDDLTVCVFTWLDYLHSIRYILYTLYRLFPVLCTWYVLYVLYRGSVSHLHCVSSNPSSSVASGCGAAGTCWIPHSKEYIRRGIRLSTSCHQGHCS